MFTKGLEGDRTFTSRISRYVNIIGLFKYVFILIDQSITDPNLNPVRWFFEQGGKVIQ